RGHLALDVWDPPTEVRFRRVLVKELKAAGAEEGFFPLLDGNDLAGWEGLPDCWSLKDGELSASVAPGRFNFNTCLCGQKAYRDFELRFEARLDGDTNSGVQVR